MANFKVEKGDRASLDFVKVGWGYYDEARELGKKIEQATGYKTGVIDMSGRRNPPTEEQKRDYNILYGNRATEKGDFFCLFDIYERDGDDGDYSAEDEEILDKYIRNNPYDHDYYNLKRRFQYDYLKLYIKGDFKNKAAMDQKVADLFAESEFYIVDTPKMSRPGLLSIRLYVWDDDLIRESSITNFVKNYLKRIK